MPSILIATWGMAFFCGHGIVKFFNQSSSSVRVKYFSLCYHTQYCASICCDHEYGICYYSHSVFRYCTKTELHLPSVSLTAFTYVQCTRMYKSWYDSCCVRLC